MRRLPPSPTPSHAIIAPKRPVRRGSREKGEKENPEPAAPIGSRTSKPRPPSVHVGSRETRTPPAFERGTNSFLSRTLPPRPRALSPSLVSSTSTRLGRPRGDETTASPASCESSPACPGSAAAPNTPLPSPRRMGADAMHGLWLNAHGVNAYSYSRRRQGKERRATTRAVLPMGNNCLLLLFRSSFSASSSSCLAPSRTLLRERESCFSLAHPHTLHPHSYDCRIRRRAARAEGARDAVVSISYVAWGGR
ncbi:hypothetical protein GGS23DRAFT_248585 [Durotheca rogersii]|uniref:uncharacterized protein n=1 Tax=Durotheca rogersii TaxID=419775 RepID=UPI00221E9FED|nr:uncharacterized protein GGS23DRAFT_248585 [Durotheca rogersii]KAI5860091.1 hypothetical protein GGS23DRAFT_248585 [Durotheca rogersii]